MQTFWTMSSLRKTDRIEEEFPKFYKKYNEDGEAFDEGVFVSEFVDGDDDEDDFDYDYIREPKTEFEKCLSKMDGVLRQSEQDAQNLSHDLKVIESKNNSTERRILKLTRDAAELRSKLNAFLQSFGRHSPWQDRVTSSSYHVSMASPRSRETTTSSPRHHKATYAIFLKQNSIEQPVRVNIPLNEKDKVLIY